MPADPGSSKRLRLRVESQVDSVTAREILDKASREIDTGFCRQTLEIRRRVLGPEHPDTLMSMNDLGGVLGKEGQYVNAERLLRQTVEIQRRVLGPGHPDTASSIYTLACLATWKGNPDEALSLLRDAVDHGLDQTHLLGMEHDSDLRRLQGDPRFRALITYALERRGSEKSQ